MKQVHYFTPVSRKKKSMALILCLFMGFFGGHYFYVGRFGRGLLALCTVNFFMIGTIIDFFKILSGNFLDKYGLPVVA